MIKEQMETIYSNLPPDKIPWNMEDLPELIADLINSGKINPCKVLEPGCGTGSYVISLAEMGFDATGIDISETAVKMAEEKASKLGVECNFYQGDVLGELPDIKDTFDFIYDWEVLHHIFPEDRKKYMKNVSRLLNRGGIYLSVCFSEDSDQFGGEGKYRKTPLDTVLYFSSEDEIEALVRPFFKIDELKTVDIKGKYSDHKAIYLLMHKT